MIWVIRNIDTGKYVAPAGSKNSYTTDILAARRFPSRDAALADCCGNEVPVNLREAVGL